MKTAFPILASLPQGGAISFSNSPRSGFTLVEIMVASIAAALVLIAIYGIFYRAVNMRDNATERTREARMRARAVGVIRNDLRNALVSGGILASTLEGDTNGNDGGAASLPGYLKLTTTTGKDNANEMYGDVQQVEYYITRDASAASGVSAGGTLVRVVTRDLLDEPQNVTHEERILPGVQSFHVSFYDGASWQDTWEISGSNSTTGSGLSTASTTTSGSNAITLPSAIRIDIQMTALSDKIPAPAPLEILVPWVTAPFISGTNYIIGSGTTQ